jgi:putative transposase
MDFAEGPIYHVYNRGNNSQTVFFTHENYLFFLDKLRKYILPHADILAWCLLPNHFHLMILVKQVKVEISEPVTPDGVNEQVTRSRLSEGFTQSEALTRSKRERTLNDSIGIILRSYTRAIQKQQRVTGSLFQKETKALCLTEPQGISPAYFNSHFGMVGNLDLPETNYLNVCFDYIHLNPVGAKLVAEPGDWEFSSYRDYFGGRKGKLVNRELAKELGLIE